MPYKVHTYTSLPGDDIRVKLANLYRLIFGDELKLVQKICPNEDDESLAGNAFAQYQEWL